MPTRSRVQGRGVGVPRHAISFKHAHEQKHPSSPFVIVSAAFAHSMSVEASFMPFLPISFSDTELEPAARQFPWADIFFALQV